MVWNQIELQKTVWLDLESEILGFGLEFSSHLKWFGLKIAQKMPKTSTRRDLSSIAKEVTYTSFDYFHLSLKLRLYSY